jgi:hypothetical protein
MYNVHLPSLNEAGAPEQEIEVTPEMIEAGADMLCDGSELGDMFSPSTATYFAEKVIRAALKRCAEK